MVPKMDIHGLVLDFILNLIYININPDICYNEN
jgi:hypothetical protein